MEPGDLRESPAGSGASDGGDWREVIPGGEEGHKRVETNVVAMDLALKDTYEGGQNDKANCAGEQFHSPYEEELDPRIQVGAPDAHLGCSHLRIQVSDQSGHLCKAEQPEARITHSSAC